MGKLKMKKYLICLLLPILFFSCNKKNNQTPENIVEKALEEREHSVDIFGTVVPGNKESISLDFGVTIKELLVDNMQEVSAGETILILDMDSYRTQLRNAENLLKQGSLELARLRKENLVSNKDILNRTRSLEANIGIAEKELEQLRDTLARKRGYENEDSSLEIRRLKNDIIAAEAELDRLEQEAENKKELLEESMVSRQQQEEAYQAVARQKLSIESLHLSLESARLGLDDELTALELQIGQKETALEDLKFEREQLRTPEQTAVEMQEFRVENLEAELDELKARIDKPWLKEDRVIALYDKTIVSYNGSLAVGDRAAQGTTLMSQIDLDDREISATVPEEFIADVTPGREAEIKALADRTLVFKGEVSRMAAMAVNNNGETGVPVTLRFEDPDRFLRPNYNVDISIKIPRKEEPPEDKVAAKEDSE